MQITGLTGTVAVVTGAARMRSIGRAITLELARAGCDVAITGTDRHPDTFPAEEREAGWLGLSSVAAEVEALGRRCLPLTPGGRGAEEHAAHMAQRVTGELGNIGVLVNNAAASRGADRVPVVDVPDGVFESVVDTNLNGAFATSRAVARAMVSAGRGGSIVNISSIGGKLAAGRTAAYAASKAGLQALTSAMAQELGPAGIRVNAVCPGIVRTSRLDDMSDERLAAVLESSVPLRRPGRPEDVAHLVVFLSSDQGAWITGQAINVDGGQLTIR
ncbi:SDR family NAD(P)-dependent oxidoreductase [Blastococcus sp. URHD0036]|uniref:SDR family NAD(P)-dependent oxidoreductase n=1 Tax=Blastococcus sp. URHD0036 TaxID=1380356 RepID=UPI00049515CC|nr:SDR family oxidoreductase [Blastococcus sp. URHD0036]